MGKVILQVVFDNLSYLPELKTAWGYSCIVETDSDTILFDAGSDGEILLHNLTKLKIDLKSISAMVISHEHWDHVGGLCAFLQKNSNVTVYVPFSFSAEGENEIFRMGAKVTRVKNKLQIAEKIYSLGELPGSVLEQSLIVDIPEGMVILTGCAHPGIVKIVENAKSLFPQKSVFLVMGGFHLKDNAIYQIREVADQLKQLGVQKVAPSHCSGNFALKYFASGFGNNFINSGVGKKIEIQKGQ
ncbi:MAG: MBL fold metallo-hydrolase [Calditrichaeota bacterium]|nr:MBL fold metallo-hydrolase [Calditrichota bacterium]